MARIVAAYSLHRQGCPPAPRPHGTADAPCPCDPYFVVVDVEFAVPRAAPLHEQLRIARRAAHEAAHLEVAKLDQGHG